MVQIQSSPENVFSPRALKYKALKPTNELATKQALVTAASRLGSLDTQSGPSYLIRLGELPIICHVLYQLQHAGIERAVILCGFQGDLVQRAVEQYMTPESRMKMRLEFVHLGDASWNQGHAPSMREARNHFKDGEQFLVCMADHIFDPVLVSKMASMRFSHVDEALCLVERDTAGMQGLPSTAVKVLFNKVDLTDLTVKSVNRTLELCDADGLEAGLFMCSTSIFDRLDELAVERAYFSLADVMDLYAQKGSLRPVETDGRIWFSVENKDALAYAVSHGMKDIGIEGEDTDWLSAGAFTPDGKQIEVQPVQVGNKAASPNHGSWSEFTVERWRSAVYINMSYFGQLYTDTCDFVCEIAKHMKLRGQRVSLCEVGCGTGEFIRPLADQFRTVIGVDFNANFIEFCNSNIPTEKESRMRFVYGDACELVALMKQKAPGHFQTDTKIVCCVGNTMGIIPDELKPKIYQQMAELAGPEGVVVIVYWNARHFGDACQNFYHANPQLCGPFDGSAINFETTTLATAAYRTHWTGIDEARSNMVKYGLEEILIEERGKGVLVAARMKTHPKTPSGSPYLGPSKAPGAP